MRQPISYCLKRSTFEPENGINIFGQTRGGTTWIFEMLRNIPGIIPQFEPLHISYGVIDKRLGWPVRPYLKAGHQDTADRKMIDEILRYRVWNDYTTDYIRRFDLTHPQRVLTKYIMGTGTLPYLLAEYTFCHPPILLLRHPIASALSYFSRWGDGHFNDDWSPADHPRYAPHLRQEARALSQYKTPLTRTLAEFCVNHREILHNSSILKHVALVYYEDFVLHPEENLEQLLIAIGLGDETEALLQTTDVFRRSKTDFQPNRNHTPEVALSRPWKNLTAKEINDAQAVFDAFGFQHYRAESPFPVLR